MTLTPHNDLNLEEKVPCEIREWPSMMWKKWIVQATVVARTAWIPCLTRVAAVFLIITILTVGVVA